MSLPKKVSRFKSDRVHRRDTTSSTPPQLLKPILGGIVEVRDTSDILLSEVSCDTPTGFPSCVRPGIAFGSSISLSKSNGQAVGTSSIPVERQHAQTCSDDDFASINSKRVANMSESEVQSALHEISASISKENLDFLKRRGKKELLGVAGEGESASRSSATIADITKGHKQAVGSLAATGSGSSATTEATGDKCIGIKTDIRFDLSGRRIIHSVAKDGEDSFSNFLEQWVDILSRSFLMHELSPAEIQDVAKYCVEALTSCAFVLSLIETAGAEGGGGAESEVLEQQEEGVVAPEAAVVVVGYSLAAACKLMCSEVKSQRLVGLRILNGAMSRRDMASSLEAYSDGHSTARASSSLSAAAVPFTETYGCLFSHIARKLATSSSFQAQNLHRVLIFAVLKTCCAADFPPEVAYLIKWNLGEFAPYSAPIYQLQSVKAAFHFMFSSLESTAGDDVLWTGVWGLRGLPFSFMSPLARRPECSYATHVDSCLRKHAAAKADNELNQAQRESLRCGENGKEVQDELTSMATRPYEEFAMLCRWRRVDTMLGASEGEEGDEGLAVALGRIVQDCLQRLISVCHDFLEHQVSFFDNVPRADEDVLMTADVLIWCLKLVSNSVRGADITTVETLHKAALDLAWPRLAGLFTLCVSKGLLPAQSQHKTKSLAMKLNGVCVSMWQVAAELAKRSIKYAEMICAHSDEVLNVIITLIARSCTQAVTIGSGGGAGALDQEVLLWALRFWRCCVAYRLSPGATLNLLLQLYSQVERLAVLFSKDVNVEIMEVLEETSVVCSAYFVGRSTSATSGDFSINDFMHIDISRIILQITAILVQNGKTLGTDSHMAGTTSTNSFLNLVASVIGVAPSLNRPSPLSALADAHIRGPGLCVSLRHFSHCCQTAAAAVTEGGEEKRDRIAARGVVKIKLQSSLDGIIVTVLQLQKLFVEMIEMRCTPVPVSWSFVGRSVVEDGFEKTTRRTRLEFETFLTGNRLALCYFSLLTVADVPLRPTAFDMLRDLISECETWMGANDKYNEDSVASGLHSVKSRQVYQLIQVTHVQLFALARALCVEGERSCDDAGWGVERVLEVMPSLAVLVPLTTCRCLRAILECVVTTALSTASAASDANDVVDAGVTDVGDSAHRVVVGLVNKVLMAVYGLRQSKKLVDEGEQGGDEDTIDSSVLQIISAVNSHSESGFLQYDNEIRKVAGSSTTECCSLVDECLSDHVSFSSLSALCRVDQHWKFTALASLRGSDLHLWLRVLHHLSSTPPMSTNAASQVSTTSILSNKGLFCAFERVEEATQQLYWLARLPASAVVALPEHQENAKDEFIAIDPLSPLSEQYQQLLQRCYNLLFEEKLFWSANRGGARCIDVYAEAGELLEIIASTQNRSLFMSRKVASSEKARAEAGAEASNTTRAHIQSKIRNHGENAGGKVERGVRSRCTGVEDLCERLMDGLTNQQFHHNVHAAAVSFFLVPGIIPWLFREKLWRTLGTMQLLHLVESPLLASSLVMFLEVETLLASHLSRQHRQEKLPGTVRDTKAVSVIVAMADALLGLRMYSEERELTITQLGLFSIAHYIFKNQTGGTEIVGMRETLLMRLLDAHVLQGSMHVETGESAASVIGDVLRIASVLRGTEDIIGCLFYQKGLSEECAMVAASDAVCNLWRHALSHSPRVVEQVEGQVNQLPSFLQYSVGRSKTVDTGDRVLLTDVLRDRSPDLLDGLAGLSS